MTMQARYSKAGKTKYESSLSQALWLDEIRAQQQCIYVSVSVFLLWTKGGGGGRSVDDVIYQIHRPVQCRRNSPTYTLPPFL